jgi:hypothetical protein
MGRVKPRCPDAPSNGCSDDDLKAVFFVKKLAASLLTIALLGYSIPMIAA